MKQIFSVVLLAVFVLEQAKMLPAIFVHEKPTMTMALSWGGTKFEHHRIVRREIGGSDALPNEFPWQVSIRDASADVHFCGGSILDETHILTAAHCKTEKVKGGATIVAGKHKLHSLEESEQRIKVESVVCHEDFRNATSGNDLAILTLARPLKFNDAVQPIGFADDDDLPLTNLRPISTGWGKINEHIWDDDLLSEVLQKVTLTLLNNSVCRDAYPEDYNYRVDERFLCAGGVTERRGPCEGDSGGPLVIYQAGRWVQIGIVSWGSGLYCGHPRYPDVFTKVAYFKGWIERQLNTGNNGRIKKFKRT